MEVTAFLRTLEKKGLSANTIAAYKQDIAVYRRWYCRDSEKNILSSTSEDIKNYFASLRRKKRSAATRARQISSLRNYFEWEKERGNIPLNPVSGIKGTKVIRKNPQYADEESVLKLKKVIDGKSIRGMRDIALIDLGASSGLNVSELIRLKLKDVDTAKRRLTPGGEPERVIELSKDASLSLKRYLTKARPGLSGENPDEDTLFLSLKGRPLTRQGVWKNLRTYSEEAGIDNVTPERLRHSSAITRLLKGESPDKVKTALGLKSHASVSEYEAIAGKLRNRK